MNNVETTLMVSRRGWAGINAAANARRVGRQAAFRDKAWKLTRCVTPKFDFTGEPLDHPFHVGLHPHVIADLHQLCDDLGVPHTCAGELVACWEGHAE